MPVETIEKKEEIIIRETVDGRPASSPSPSRARTADDRKEEEIRGKADPYIWGIYLMLLMVSVIELFSASSSEVTAANVYTPLIRHGVFLAIGFVTVLGLQRLHFGYISRFSYLFGAVSLALLLLSSVAGVNINGAQRAIQVAGFTIQPAEIVKLSVVVLLATILGRNQRPGGVAMKGIVLSALVVVCFAGFTYRNGLTNTVLLMGVSLCMFLIGGIPWSKIGVVVVIYGVLGGGAYFIKESSARSNEFDELAQSGMVTEQVASDNADASGRTGTWKARLSRFLRGTHPEDPIDDLNRQVVFSKFAQANGGVMGRGPGNSRETARLPLAFSDYIFSIIVEDTGLVGGIILMVIYLLLLARAGRIAYKCSRAFPAFLILGCAVLIVFQALVHMAIVSDLGPVSGQPLPLISKGGTSVLVMSAAIGIMLSVSRYAATSDNKKAIRAEARELPSDLQAANMSAGYTKGKS